MTTSPKMQPETAPSRKLDVPAWLIALIAVLGIVYAAGAQGQRIDALERDHVGKAEIQAVQKTVESVQTDVRELNKNVMKALSDREKK